jgi:hypothetical protein
MTNKLTLTESMSQLQQKLHDIEQHTVNEGKPWSLGAWTLDKLEKVYGKLTGKAAEEALVKELGEKVTITNEKGQVQNWILRIDDTGAKYHLEGKDARISPEDMKARKASEPRNDPSIPPEITEPHPTLLGPDGKPLQVPAKPKPAITNPVVKAIADEPISTDVPEITNMGSLYQYFKEQKPAELKKLEQNPTANKGFWKAVSGKAKSNKGKIAIAGLLLLLYFWASPDKTKEKATSSTANAGAKTSEDGSAPVGTVIPADEIPWKWVMTGSNDPDVLDKAKLNKTSDEIKNVKDQYDRLKSEAVTKNVNGQWQTSRNAVPAGGKTSARLEQLAKMDPEKRKELAKAENTLTYNSVELYRPGEDGPKLPVVPPVVTNDENEEPAQREPEIALPKKKKKDPKVLPTVKW